ncbi:MAG TPA: alpha/beta hydrolase [Stellaceae bacterium]|jgi:pimeloyl-ACP methyl ester carboxylesterase
MPFIASNGLTEEGTGNTISAGGLNVHYHDVGAGEPVLFLHSYGPGTTAWITFHKVVGELSRHYRCILMDLPNFSKTGPIVYRESLHALQARTAVALLDALGIEKAHWVGNSQGGQSSMVAAAHYPDRVTRFVMGGSHIGTGGDRYLMANRPSEGARTTLRTIADPSPDNIRRYLHTHINDDSLVTDELVAYIHHAHTWSPEFLAARAQSVSLPHDYAPDLPGIKAPVLLIHGRYDRMVPFEVSIAILNHIEDSRLVLLSNCGHWPPFEKSAEWTAQVLAFLKGY